MRRLIFPVLLGVLGCAVLLGLGTWQLQRLGWKQAVLAELAAQIHADPVALPPAGAVPVQYQAVTATGKLAGNHLRVLVGLKMVGPGYRIIAPLQLTDRRVLVDLGFVADGRPVPELAGPVTVTGNLHNPVEVDSFTPEPDLAKNIWFARDLPAMAAALGTEPLLIVARAPVVAGITPIPVGTEGIPNDHWEYALTWFMLAAVWAVMSLLLAWRSWHRR